MKLQITIDDNLALKIDKIVKERFTTRSSIIGAALSEYILHYEIRDLIEEIDKTIKKIEKDGKLDNETIENLNKYQKECENLYFKK